jgi:hypothetical protein
VLATDHDQDAAQLHRQVHVPGAQFLQPAFGLAIDIVEIQRAIPDSPRLALYDQQ